jgi:copper chaperone CopZ
MTYTLNISGMSCDHCVRRVRKALGTVPGVTVEQVEVGRAVVADDDEPNGRAAVVRVLDEAGYAAEIAR